MNKEDTVEIKLKKNKIIIEQVSKKIVNNFNLDQNNEEFYNFACFNVLSKESIRYFPFNKLKYLNYDAKLPPITSKSCVLTLEQGMDALNKLLLSGMWKVWGQDEKEIQRLLDLKNNK